MGLTAKLSFTPHLSHCPALLMDDDRERLALLSKTRSPNNAIIICGVLCSCMQTVDVDDLKKILMFKIPAKSPAAIKNKCQQALKQATTS
jgi:hypothetical protein